MPIEPVFVVSPFELPQPNVHLLKGMLYITLKAIMSCTASIAITYPLLLHIDVYIYISTFHLYYKMQHLNNDDFYIVSCQVGAGFVARLL